MDKVTEHGVELLNSYFDCIYVLTLPRAKKRQEALELNLEGLNWELFYGVDKQDLDFQELIEKKVYDDSLHHSIKRTHRSMTLGEIACALSHRKIMEDAIKKEYQRFLILEDDTKLDFNALANIGAAIEELPVNWGLLMLGYYGEKKPILANRLTIWFYILCHYLRLGNWDKVSVRWIKKICLKPKGKHLYELGKLVGGHGYAVSSETAKKIVKFQTPITVQADRVFNYSDDFFSDNSFALKDKVFLLSDESYSSFIGYEKKDREKPNR